MFVDIFPQEQAITEANALREKMFEKVMPQPTPAASRDRIILCPPAADFAVLSLQEERARKQKEELLAAKKAELKSKRMEKQAVHTTPGRPSVSGSKLPDTPSSIPRPTSGLNPRASSPSAGASADTFTFDSNHSTDSGADRSSSPQPSAALSPRIPVRSSMIATKSVASPAPSKPAPSPAPTTPAQPRADTTPSTPAPALASPKKAAPSRMYVSLTEPQNAPAHFFLVLFLPPDVFHSYHFILSLFWSPQSHACCKNSIRLKVP
jgi:hypothetical protein